MGTIAHDSIASDPAIMGGKPTIRSTRITIELVPEELADRMSTAEIRAAHPHLAADYLRREEIIFGEPGIAV